METETKQQHKEDTSPATCSVTSVGQTVYCHL